MSDETAHARYEAAVANMTRQDGPSWAERFAADPTDWEAAYEMWTQGHGDTRNCDEARWAFEAAFSFARTGKDVG